MSQQAVSLQNLTPEQLAKLQERLRVLRGENPAPAGIPRRTGTGPVPLSFAQQRLWFVDRLEPQNTGYNTPTALRLLGALDRGVLARSLDEVARRHETLRTSLPMIDGEPMQVIAPPAPRPLPLVDLAALPADVRERETQRLVREEPLRPVNLTTGPLLRTTLLRLAEEEHVVLFTMHHVISDAWSTRVLMRELTVLYGAFSRGEPSPLPELPVQYADYTLWQRERVSGALLEEQLAYWRETLAGAPAVLELPTDRPRTAWPDPAGVIRPFQLPAELGRALEELAHREGATLFMTLLAAWQLVLGRWAGQDDVVVGSPIANRTRREVEGIIGLFANTLALRGDLSGDPTFLELLARVRETTLGAHAHQDLPFERLVQALDVDRNAASSPVFQAMMVFGSLQAHDTLNMGDVEAIPMEIGTGAALFDLVLMMSEWEGTIYGALDYRTAFFDASTIDRLLGHYRVVLEAVAADPGRRISTISLLTPAERHQLLAEWNATDIDVPAGDTVHGLFAAQAGRTPDATALVFTGGTLAYGELDAWANRLANHLRGLGVGPETRVGVCLERTPALVVALLGVLKAGGAYVPLDPAYPRERLGWMAEDAGVRYVLTTAALVGHLPEGAEPIAVDTLAESIAAGPAQAPSAGVHPENLSHVIFTSGSTGRPSGVMIRHHAVAVLLHWMGAAISDEERAAVLASTSVSFDVSVAEIFGTLCWGGTLVLVENALSLPEAAGQGIRSASMVPTAAAELLRSGGIPASVRSLNLGGEALPADLVRALYDTGTVRTIRNLYGPTEDTTYSTWCVVEPGAERVLIGRPLAGARAYVLEGGGLPAPAAVAGELYLAGEGLARGYAGRPGLTAARFLPDPFGPAGSRMYRTLDRARWMAEGALESLGRADFQVKVRGFRIEPEEVEAALRMHPAIHQAVVVAREDVPGDRRLVGYLVAGEGHEVPPVQALRAHLAARLPEHMIPSAFVPLPALPRTPSGKTDRRALPAPAVSAAAHGDEEGELCGLVQEMVAELFAELLHVPRVGPRADFFALGGHSLLATRLVSRVRESFGVELPLRTVFDAPTVEQLAAHVEWLLAEDLQEEGPPAAPLPQRAVRVDAPRGDGATERAADIVPVPRDRPIPLSFAQQRLWFIHQLDPGTAAYNMVGITRMDGALDAAALQGAVDTVVDRHEALRTVFVLGDGGPVQQVVDGVRIALEGEDLQDVDAAERDAEVQRRARAAQARPFDLAAGPLLRVSLLRLAPDSHALVLVMHHVISDGWSQTVIVDEISAAYTALVQGETPRLPALPVQYPDYAVWQRERLQGAFLAEQLDYWRGALAGAPPVLALPTDHPRPAVQSSRGRAHRFALPTGIEEPLRAIAREGGATLFMALLAAFQSLLSRYSGQPDLVVGTPVANRGRGETEGLIGFFVNMLPLRTDLSGDPSFREAVRRVRETALGAYAHDEVPFERLVEALGIERSLSRNQIFQVVFQANEFPRDEPGLPGLRLSSMEVASETSTFDMTLAVSRDAAGLVGRLEYATALFDASTAERMAEHLNELLRGVVGHPDAPVAALGLMSGAERAQVAGWNATDRGYPAGVLVPGLFAAQVARTPDATAVVFRGQALSYAQLDARANRLAHHLRGVGAGVEARVGVCLERTPELIVALLAVHKAGGAYVPLDPAYPRGRLGCMIEDADVRLVLTTRALADRLPPGAGAVRIDSLADRIAAEPAEVPRVEIHPDNLSHVIFTSGSTGRPKGVMIRHAGSAVLVHWMRETLTDEERAGVLASTSINFDVSVAEIFGTLCWGGRLVLVENALSLPDVADQDVRYASMVPTAAAELLRAGGIPASVRTLNLGGEALPNELAQALYTNTNVGKVGNLYGPTEDTTYSTYSVVPRGADRVLVGGPVANTTAYVLDDALRPAGVGIVGELYLAGNGLARGYAGRPGLTAERFVPDPFGAPGSRMYRVMDRVRWTSSGELEYFGRTDFQVKIRGFRIELGEIETALASHPAVRESVVTAWDDGTGERRLVAYVTASAEADPPSGPELRRWVGDRLPEYMVPSLFVPLDALPLTPNGKIDRRALPEPGVARPELEEAYALPRNDLEETISDVWRGVLGVERVGIRDNFFELGGTSVRLASVHRLLGERLGREVTVVDLFRYPTVAGLAEFLGQPGEGERRRDEVQDRAERQRQAQAARQRGRARR